MIVVHPGDDDVKSIETTVDQIPLCIVGGLLIAGPVAQPGPFAGSVSAFNAVVVTALQLRAVNPNIDLIEFYPQSIALGIGDGVVLDLLVTVVIGGFKLDLKLNNFADVGGGVSDPLLSVFVPNQLAEIRAGDLVLVDDVNIGGVAGDGNSRVVALVDQVVAVVQTGEGNSGARNFFCFVYECKLAFFSQGTDHIGQISNDIAVLSVFVSYDLLGCFGVGEVFVGNGAIGIVSGNCAIFDTTIAGEHIVVDGCVIQGVRDGILDAVAVSISCVFIVGCVKNLVQLVAVAEGCVGNGNGALIGFCCECSYAQRQNHCQCQNDCKCSFHIGFPFF